MVADRHATHRIAWHKIHQSPLFDISQFILLVVWFTVAGMYLAVTVTLSFIVNWMEHRFKVVT